MKTNIIFAIILALIVISCETKNEQTNDVESGLIEITKAQFVSEKMQIGEPMMHPFADAVSVTGNIVPSVDGKAQISLPLSGLINKIHCKPGQYIGRGGAIFEISGNELLDLQKDYAESSAIISRLKSEYLRTKELYLDKISTQKDLNLAESSYLAENAKLNSLKMKLANIGLDVTKIEKGEFYSNFTLKSPINGFVSGINATLGQYVEPQQIIAEIIDDKSFQLKLSVFEKDINKIRIGQTVEFNLNGSKSQNYQAIINSVGKNIQTDSKSIECYAIIGNNNNLNIVANQFIEGKVYTSVDSVISIPESAIINSENDSYILEYVKEDGDKFYFKKIKVKTGRKSDKYIELLEKLQSAKLLINGVYNIAIE